MISSQLWIIMATMTRRSPGMVKPSNANAKLQFWMDRYGRSIFKADTTTRDGEDFFSTQFSEHLMLTHMDSASLFRFFWWFTRLKSASGLAIVGMIFWPEVHRGWQSSVYTNKPSTWGVKKIMDGDGVYIYNYNYIYIYIWVNYNELTTSSLEIIVSKGNHPQMALIQVRYISTP